MIYLITNRKLCNSNEYLKKIEGALSSGIKNVILREKDLNSSELYDLSKQVKNICERFNGNLIVNDNMEVARKVKAYGLQLSYSKFLSVRDFLKCESEFKSIKIGVSIHSLEEAIECDRLGVDYLLCSNIFETACKIGKKGMGLNFIKELKENINSPIVALGGINIKNAQSVWNSGADGIAIMSLVMGCDIKRIKNICNEINKT